MRESRLTAVAVVRCEAPERERVELDNSPESMSKDEWANSQRPD